MSARSLIRSASFAQWMSSGIISASRWDSLRWEISTRYAFICSRISSTSRSAVSIDSGLTDVLPRLLLSATEATVHARRVISATAEAAACKARAGATSRLGSSVSVRDSPLERIIVSQIRASAGMKADSRMTFPMLKSVWAMATWRPGFAPAKLSPGTQRSTRWKNAGAPTPPGAVNTKANDAVSIIVPSRLKSAWANAVRRAFAFVPIAASPAVTVVPMLSPRTIGIAVQMLMAPASASAMVMPIVADELWTSIVHRVPTAIAPSTHPNGRCPVADGVQSNVEKNRMNAGISVSDFSSWLMTCMP